MPLMFPAGNMFIGKFSLFAEFASLMGNSGHYPGNRCLKMANSSMPWKGCIQLISLKRPPDRLQPPSQGRPLARREWLAILSWVSTRDAGQESGQPLPSSHLSEWLNLQAAGLAVAQREVALPLLPSLVPHNDTPQTKVAGSSAEYPLTREPPI